MQTKVEDLCAWVKQVKKIDKIDMFDLIAMIPEYEQWLSENSKVWAVTHVTCDLCGHTWVAVHHVDTPKLECSGCGNMTIY